MTFISYAQNGEDVILWRALKEVEKGFYIDVGAADPSDLSVTRAFYEHGWSGINLEPSRVFFERCQAARPRDLNLNVAASEQPGRLRFLNVPGTGLSTLVEEVAAAAAARGFAVEPQEVEARTLASICDEAGVGEIHFLKIDVEGAERAVLAGADFARFRPWVVVVEATVPLSTERNEAGWEGILLQAGYQRAFFDGVNLYFVAAEHADLLPALAVPPHALDDFKPAALAEAEARIAALTAGLAAREAAAAQAEARLKAEQAQLEAAHRELARAERRIEEQDRQLREGAQRLRRQAEVLEQVTQLLAQEGGGGEGEIPARLRALLADRAREAAILRNQYADLARHREELLASTSWRLTAPLRKTRTAIHVIRREPRQFVPLLLGNLRSRAPAGGLPLLSPAAGPAPAEMPPLPQDYERLPHRDKLVAFLRADIRRQRQLLGGA
jgi:FkbM family methyltransferase